MNIDIDPGGIDREEAGGQRIAPRGQQLPVGLLDRVGQAARLHRTVVDEEEDAVAAGAMVRRRRGQPLHPQPRLYRLPGEGEGGGGGLSSPEFVQHTAAIALAAAAEERTAVHGQGDRHRGPGESGLGADARDRRPLAAGAAQELAAGGLAAEEVAHLDRGPQGRACRFDRPGEAAAQGEAGAQIGTRDAAETIDLGRRRDAGQRLPAEAEAAQSEQVVRLAQFGGGVALEGERQLIGGDAAAVIGEGDQPQPGLLGRDGDAGGARIERVLDQLLHHRGGALDHLARRDLRRHRGRQRADVAVPVCALPGRGGALLGYGSGGRADHLSPSPQASCARERRA